MTTDTDAAVSILRKCINEYMEVNSVAHHQSMYAALAAVESAAIAPVAATQPAHEEIIREGDQLTCTACGTSTPVAAIQPAGDVAVLRKRVEDAREAAYTFGEYPQEAARIAIEGVLDLIDEWDAERTATMPAQPDMNQCDGCRQGSLTRDGTHFDLDGHAFMVCQSSRYAASAQPEAKGEWLGSIRQIICDLPIPDEKESRRQGSVDCKVAILNALRAAPQPPDSTELRDALIELTSVQHKLIEANAEIAAFHLNSMQPPASTVIRDIQEFGCPPGTVGTGGDDTAAFQRAVDSMAGAPEVQASPAVGNGIGDDVEFVRLLAAIHNGVRGGMNDAAWDACIARQCKALIAYIDARSAASAKDAERYRWLLANYARGDGYHDIDAALNDGEPEKYLGPAIDAAIATTKAAK